MMGVSYSVGGGYELLDLVHVRRVVGETGVGKKSAARACRRSEMRRLAGFVDTRTLRGAPRRDTAEGVGDCREHGIDGIRREDGNPIFLWVVASVEGSCCGPLEVTGCAHWARQFIFCATWCAYWARLFIVYATWTFTERRGVPHPPPSRVIRGGKRSELFYSIVLATWQWGEQGDSPVLTHTPRHRAFLPCGQSMDVRG